MNFPYSYVAKHLSHIHNRVRYMALSPFPDSNLAAGLLPTPMHASYVRLNDIDDAKQNPTSDATLLEEAKCVNADAMLIKKCRSRRKTLDWCASG